MTLQNDTDSSYSQGPIRNQEFGVRPCKFCQWGLQRLSGVIAASARSARLVVDMLPITMIDATGLLCRARGCRNFEGERSRARCGGTPNGVAPLGGIPKPQPARSSLSFPRLAKRLKAIGLNRSSKTMARNSSNWRHAGTSSQLRFNTYVARIAAL